jgi:hypothetical protein
MIVAESAEMYIFAGLRVGAETRVRLSARAPTAA